jgi:hypothetical protein
MRQFYLTYKDRRVEKRYSLCSELESVTGMKKIRSSLMSDSTSKAGKGEILYSLSRDSSNLEFKK